MKKDDRTPTWRPPTRRRFVAMLGAAAAAVVIRETKPIEIEKARRTANGRTRWIGHC